LPTRARFSKPGASLADFCNLVTTHEHTLRAFRSSHASGALAPLHAGTNGCRLRWPCDALPHREPVSRSLLTTACARRDPLAWRGRLRIRTAREKVRRALFGRTRAYPSRRVLGIRVTDSKSDEAWRTPSHFASAKALLERHPAKADAVEKTEMPSSVREPLRERRIAPSCAPGP